MSTLKKCKVVMLSTKEKSNISLYRGDKKDRLIISSEPSGLTHIKQHLYILSEEEPKVGDRAYSKAFGVGEIILKFQEECFYSGHESGGSITTPWKRNIGNDCKKIIATTAKLETSDKVFHDTFKQHSPQPSQSFIEKYIAKWNEGNPITDVMVEYFKNSDTGNNIAEWEEVRINPKDNTITIRPVKELFDVKDVVRFMELLAVRGCLRGLESKSGRNYAIARQTFNEVFGIEYEDYV